MNISFRHPLTALLSGLVVTIALTGCDAVETGIEAGQMAAATLEHMTTQVDRLLGEVPEDVEAAKPAVAGAVQEMASEAEYDPNLTQAALVVIRDKVDSWDLEGGQEIVDILSGLESKLKSGEVEDVQGAVDEVVEALEPGDTQ